MSLANIRIVLVRPTHPGNIGGTARAMKNMGLDRLCLVSPERFPDDEAEARAADASNVLSGALVFDTLEAAVGDCVLTIGTSSRARRIGWPTLTPNECAERLVATQSTGPVALLFGQERTGLTNEELDRCHAVVSIPVSPAYPSLNLVCAVQILAYEILQAFQRSDGALARGAAAEELAPATREELDRFYEHLERVLVRIGFLDPANPRLLMRRLTRLFNRAEPVQSELNILRGILTAVEHPERHKT